MEIPPINDVNVLRSIGILSMDFNAFMLQPNLSGYKTKM